MTSNADTPASAANGPIPTTNGVGVTVDSLPPEALALATRLFEAARTASSPSSPPFTLLSSALAAGLPANLTNHKGDSLIMLAAYHGHAAAVRLLVSHGADPNRLNDRGQSPLAGVVFKNEEECVNALLEAGADPELGEPSALDACRVFRQEGFEGLFREQIDKLRRAREEELAPTT